MVDDVSCEEKTSTRSLVPCTGSATREEPYQRTACAFLWISLPSGVNYFGLVYENSQGERVGIVSAA